MSSKAQKRRDRKKAREVNREERIKPTPETAEKLQPHPMELLLQRGREYGGIDTDQWQCAEEIVDAYAAVAPSLGLVSADLDRIGGNARNDNMGPHAEHLTELWFAWALEMRRRWRLKRPVAIVERISSQHVMTPTSAALLGKALDLWAKVRHDLAPSTREVSTIRVKGRLTGDPEL